MFVTDDKRYMQHAARRLPRTVATSGGALAVTVLRWQMHQQKQTGPRYSREGRQIRMKTDKYMLMVVIHETAPSKQLSQLISVDFGERVAMKILEQVIDAMVEGSDHKAFFFLKKKKKLIEQCFADHPDMAERRQWRHEHKRND